MGLLMKNYELLKYEVPNEPDSLKSIGNGYGTLNEAKLELRLIAHDVYLNDNIKHFDHDSCDVITALDEEYNAIYQIRGDE